MRNNLFIGGTNFRFSRIQTKWPELSFENVKNGQKYIHFCDTCVVAQIISSLFFYNL